VKSEILNKGDKIIITQEFIDNNIKIGNTLTSIWKLGSIATVCEIDEYSRIRLYRGMWSVWTTNPIAENMRSAYLNRVKLDS